MCLKIEMRSRNRQLIFLFAVVFLMYSPSIFAELSRLDDDDMVQGYRQLNDWSFKEIFFPSIRLLYYRPFLLLSFFFDKHVFGMNTALMHVHNMLLHIANALLVYLITYHVSSQDEKNEGRIPLIAGLFFGLHPLTAESVNWLSGRSDLLCGFFVLLSAYLVLRFKYAGATKYFILSLVAFLLGVLTKEVAIAFLPGIFFILLSRDHAGTRVNGKSVDNERGGYKKAILVLLGGALILYFALISAAFTPDAKIRLSFKIISSNIPYAAFTFLRAFGFYIKKIFIPYPLNLAILEVDPLYELLAIPIVLLCIFIALRRTIVSALFMTGVFLITPSFIIAVGQIAWTRYAERYLYVPLGFFLISVLLYLDKNLQFPSRTVKKAAVVALLLVMSVYTLNRTITWQTNRRLCEDTLKQSPQCKDILLIYGGVLDDMGNYEGAIAQFKKAASLPSIGYDEKADLYIAETERRRGNIGESIALNEKVFQKSQRTSQRALSNLISLMEEKRGKSATEEEKKAFDRKLLEYNEALYGLNRNPHILYKLGNIATTLGDRKKALEYFEAAYEALPADDKNRTYCQSEVKRLRHEFSN